MASRKNQAHKSEILDTSRIDESRWRRIINQLSTQQGRSEVLSRRRYDREPLLRCPRIPFTVKQPGGHEAKYLAWSRDLSDAGIGLLVGTFVYPGSTVRLELRAEGTLPVSVTGRVKYCSHLEQHLHVVGVEFDELINAKSFLFDSGTMQTLEEIEVEAARASSSL